jgi:hypothetical protein
MKQIIKFIKLMFLYAIKLLKLDKIYNYTINTYNIGFLTLKYYLNRQD